MRAETLTISIPNIGCDKNCPYCVSKMTGSTKADLNLMRRNGPKVAKLASMARVNSVLITSKGEPLVNLNNVLEFLSYFNEWPVAIQTNGRKLYNELKKGEHQTISKLWNAGLNVLAVSVDSDTQLTDEVPLIAKAARDLGLVTRLTFNVNSHLTMSVKDILRVCKEIGVNQATFRRLSIPVNGNQDEEAAKWIKDNTEDDYYASMFDEVLWEEDPIVIKTTADGTEIYDCDGVSVAFPKECIQEYAREDEIRSLIFKEDGHLYTSWNSDASILF